MNIQQIKSCYKANPWKCRILTGVLILFLLFAFVRIILTPAIIYSATSWLKNQGIESTIEDIDLNIIDGTVSLINAKGSKDGKTLFKIGLIDIYWRWSPLSEKTIVVTKVALDQLAVNIEQYTDLMIVGGVKIPLTKESSEKIEKQDVIEENAKEVKPWAASLGEVIFTELDICYLQHTNTKALANVDNKFVDYCVNLQDMTWGGTISYATDKTLLKTNDIPLSSTGNFTLNGLTITDNTLNKILLTTNSNTLEQVVISGLNNINIDKIIMGELSALKRDDQQHSDTVRFTHLSLNNIKLQNLNNISIDSISLDAPGVYLVKNKNDDWEYQHWIPGTNENEKPVEKTDSASGPSTSTLQLTLNTVIINNPDFCHQDTAKDFYYCFTTETINWDGAVKYESKASTNDLGLTAKGDLLISQLDISNQVIKRSLLNFNALELKGLDVANLETINLAKASINKLYALQRSDKQTDATLAFNDLTIDDIKYVGDGVSVNTIALTGLANTVSKNKSGSWEHDKWQVKSKPSSKAAEKENKKGTKKSFKISLKKATIQSDKNISFIDNSTTPVMTVGLTKLSFDINKLYSSKPKSDSPFKLFAKTTRHSTVDVAGTVRPFDDKVSFTADGDLKGFDLRAATPATKKAIGHIIKSGQLDAKLKLLAKDGILDSNVGLSLYKFHIEPTSKEAAAELDAQFGMPLNQTLVLLRDKDDSIHLDLPITGDINNPSFNPMDAIIKATTKATSVALITFYTPYGLVYAGGNVLFNIATALDFDPVIFKAGDAELNAENIEQLDKLTKLLTEKPQVHLTLCGMTNQADLFALYPDLKPEQSSEKEDTASLKQPEIVLTTEAKEALKQLAITRQDNSKNHLIDVAKITHDRLILCEPAVEIQKDGLSGVEINI